MSVQIWDLLVVGVILFSVVRGAVKGLVWQLATIASIVLCFLFAGSISSALAPMIGLKEPLNRWVAMFLLYLVFSFAAFAVARSMKNLIEEAKFTEYDRHMGAVLGLLKGVGMALILTFFSVTLSEQARDHVMGTVSGRYAAVIMDRLHPVMPEELHAVLEPYIHQLDQDDIDLQHAHHDSHDGHQDHDHAEEETDHPPFVDDSSSNSTANSDRTRLQQLIAQLPGLENDPELQELAVNALLNTDPDHRGQLIDLLSTGIPALTKIIAIEWQNGKPSEAVSNEETRNRLLREISGIYFTTPNAQEAFELEITDSLAGLPTRIEASVLEDWHADLLGLDPDPDPNTDFRSELDRRIYNQVKYAGLNVESLDTALQERLSSVR
ncbi:MAG: CvpA family protein [Planctomycetaceae bacterium]|nr:CvpA family protein [Planctomycetaceae bacterium]